MPPLQASFWRGVCTKLFNENSNIVLMTDSAAAYDAVTHEGIKEHHTVNHSEKEFSRSVSVLKDTHTGARRPGCAGTQLLDHEWSMIKQQLPRNLTAKTPAGQEKLRGAHSRRPVATNAGHDRSLGGLL